MPEKEIDILGSGVATVDDLLTVAAFPKYNDKFPLDRFERQGGGLTATALVAASRLGKRARMILSLGGDDLSAFIRAELTRAGVELHETGDVSDPEVRPFHSFILIERNSGERAIVWKSAVKCDPVIGDGEKALLYSAKCLLIDHFFASAVLPLAVRARELGLPIVGDFERESGGGKELMALANHIIIPLGFASQVTGITTPAEATKALFRMFPSHELACVTDSERGCWYVTKEKPEEARHQPAFGIDHVVDATGCGDVFHGAYAAFVVEGRPAEERIRLAAATAAIKAGKAGAQKGCPTRAELDAFLAR